MLGYNFVCHEKIFMKLYFLKHKTSRFHVKVFISI